MIPCNPSPWLQSALFVCFASLVTICHGDPTKGFTAVSLQEKNFKLQIPYDKQPNQRYNFTNGVRRLWVYSDDKPFDRTSNTKPRTEMRMTGYDYSDGVWQFEGYGYVPKGTTGVSIMQVFNASDHATSFMLHVYDGQLKYYTNQVIEDNIYDRWFRVNVIHSVGENISVFINGVQKYVAPDRGGTDHYFKFGVYTQRNSSHRMESWWRDVKIYKKSKRDNIAIRTSLI